MKLDELKHLPIEGITIDKDNNYFLIADVALISTDSDILKPYLILGTLGYTILSMAWCTL
ncbi:MAG: hypothetical protein QXK76_04340 [Candidatus Woesearchaeota archaeon]